MHIVADDVAAQSRQYRTDVPAGDDALQALADKFAAMDNCSVLYNQDKPASSGSSTPPRSAARRACSWY